jgi:hypothetical protein
MSRLLAVAFGLIFAPAVTFTIVLVTEMVAFLGDVAPIAAGIGVVAVAGLLVVRFRQTESLSIRRHS